MFALTVDSRGIVDAMNRAAAAHGGQADMNPAQDPGVMVGRDLDGPLCGPIWMEQAGADWKAR